MIKVVQTVIRRVRNDKSLTIAVGTSDGRGERREFGWIATPGTFTDKEPLIEKSQLPGSPSLQVRWVNSRHPYGKMLSTIDHLVNRCVTDGDLLSLLNRPLST